MRRDIQFLRGIAVLFVVLYHSSLGLFNKGYLGVDVFFVLSGFLITSIILKGLDNNNFHFSTFYLRRAKRLLPALYSTLLFTTLFCLVVLTNQQWIEYLSQLAGALTFTANMVLPSQTGYFESAAEGKPLLHIWSLSLEEQYYFLLPVLLYIPPKNYRLIVILLFAAVSLFWCFSWVYSENQEAPFLWRIAASSKSEWAFYLLFTRAWELLAGSLCAWIMLNKPTVESPRFLKLVALVFIFITCIINTDNEHPGIESVIVVVSTMAILLGNKEWLPNHYLIRFVEKAGDWSYSIYLVHWPLFALAYLSYVGDVPTSTKVILIFASMFFGYIQFRYVETPFRGGKFKRLFSNWKLAISTTIILLVIPLVSAYTSSNVEDEFAHIRRINFGFGEECRGTFDKNGILKSSCLDGNKPEIAVWGDSYAMHLIPGLAERNTGIVQLTKSVCGPIINLAPITENPNYDKVWAKECLEFNNHVYEYVKNHGTITHVILSSTLVTYLKFGKAEYLTHKGSKKADHQFFIDSFKNTISMLIRLGITPVIISPPPKSGFNVGECLERKYGPALLLRDSCDIDFNEYQENQRLVDLTLKKMESDSKVIWLRDYLCKDGTCETDIDGTFIYRDNGHLSIGGSVKLLKDLDIKNL